MDFVINRAFIKGDYLLQKKLGNVLFSAVNRWSILFGWFEMLNIFHVFIIWQHTFVISSLRCAQKTLLEMLKTTWELLKKEENTLSVETEWNLHAKHTNCLVLPF